MNSSNVSALTSWAAISELINSEGDAIRAIEGESRVKAGLLEKNAEAWAIHPRVTMVKIPSFISNSTNTSKIHRKRGNQP
jgi:hypothetical protein